MVAAISTQTMVEVHSIHCLYKLSYKMLKKTIPFQCISLHYSIILDPIAIDLLENQLYQKKNLPDRFSSYLVQILLNTKVA